MRADPALPQSPPCVYRVPGILVAIRDVIGHERDNIGNALSALECLRLAMEALELPFDGPHARSARLEHNRAALNRVRGTRRIAHAANGEGASRGPSARWSR